MKTYVFLPIHIHEYKWPHFLRLVYQLVRVFFCTSSGPCFEKESCIHSSASALSCWIDWMVDEGHQKADWCAGEESRGVHQTGSHWSKGSICYIYIHMCVLPFIYMYVYIHVTFTWQTPLGCREDTFHLPRYIHTYLPTYIPTYLNTYIPTYIHTYLHTYTPSYLHTYTPTNLHTYIPTSVCLNMGTCHNVVMKTCEDIIHMEIYIHIYIYVVRARCLEVNQCCFTTFCVQLSWTSCY